MVGLSQLWWGLGAGARFLVASAACCRMCSGVGCAWPTCAAIYAWSLSGCHLSGSSVLSAGRLVASVTIVCSPDLACALSCCQFHQCTTTAPLPRRYLNHPVALVCETVQTMHSFPALQMHAPRKPVRLSCKPLNSAVASFNKACLPQHFPQKQA